MAKLRIRYLTSRPGAEGLRYFWQPSAALVRAGWRLIRLPDERRQAIAKAEQLNAELDAWRKGETIATGPAPVKTVDHGTLAWVIRQYKASRFYLDLAPRTKRTYDHDMKTLEAWGGAKPVASLEPKRWDKLYTELRKATPTKARNLIAMGRILMQAAIREQLIQINPCLKLGIAGAKPSGRVWPRDAVDAFVAAADALDWHSVGTAVRINHWLGQRQGDILRLKPAAWYQKRVAVTQNKTDARVRVPSSALVDARVEAELGRQRERRLAGTTLLLHERTGRPWTETDFRHVFAEIRAHLAERQPVFVLADGSEVATRHLWFMHLRHTVVTDLAIAGATPLQIAAVTGHSPQTVNRILERYLVLTTELAQAATDKRIAYDKAREGGE